jgi:hypothetical protein
MVEIALIRGWPGSAPPVRETQQTQRPYACARDACAREFAAKSGGKG